MNQGNDIPQSGGSNHTASSMPNLSSLDCFAVAVNRIEIYVPGEATEPTLDGYTNACAKHTAELLEVVGWDVDGVTAHCVALPDGSTAVCGSSQDFATDAQALERIDAKLREARQAQRQAHAAGYCKGVAAQIDGRGHALFVEADEDRADTFAWVCACGWMTIQYPALTEQNPIQSRLIEHVTQARAIDERTAKALEIDGCSCPSEVGDHRHEVYFRRLASTGQVAHIVVDSFWMGGRMELLCWPISARGIALAQQWVSEHAARWHDGSPVVTEDLARRAAHARWGRS